ncbi:DUF3221 domain-containing protein [Chryseomicrobium aureum]|uniref:DUF3221 domain-containing protein n=1 Tax=Chryseomicrobium aureum TaxID=1441723 RepID=UPI00370DCBE9
MKKKYVLYLVSLLVILLTACQQTTNESQFYTEVGRIVAIEDSRFLLVKDATEQDIETLEPVEIIEKYEDGIWATYEKLDELKVNAVVRASYDVMQDTLPAYGNAVQVEVLEDSE